MFAIAAFFILACSKETVVAPVNNGSTQMSILSFESPESLLESIEAGENYSIGTKTSGGPSFYNLFTKISQIEMDKDPMLSYEISKADFEGDISLYKVLGYDELVPNEKFARLLNTHGEFQVGNTVYKISPHGTYYFPVAELEQFEARYEEFESMDGEIIGERTFQLTPSIYRYDTFSAMKEQTELQDVTKAGPIPGYNWNQAETHVGSASEVFENQIFYKELQWNVRMKTRVYNHDYVAYQERGAYVKTQNKTWIGWWADKTATALALGWNNIIMTKPYNEIYGPILPGTIPHITGTSTESFDNQAVSVIEITGYTIPESDYSIIINGNYSTLRTRLANAIGIDIIGYDLVRLIDQNIVQVICPQSYKSGQNIDEAKAVFSYATMGQCYQFAAGQFYYVGQDNDLVGTMRVGTSF